MVWIVMGLSMRRCLKVGPSLLNLHHLPPISAQRLLSSSTTDRTEDGTSKEAVGATDASPAAEEQPADGTTPEQVPPPQKSRLSHMTRMLANAPLPPPPPPPAAAAKSQPQTDSSSAFSLGLLPTGAVAGQQPATALGGDTDGSEARPAVTAPDALPASVPESSTAVADASGSLHGEAPPPATSETSESIPQSTVSPHSSQQPPVPPPRKSAVSSIFSNISASLSSIFGGGGSSPSNRGDSPADSGGSSAAATAVGVDSASSGASSSSSSSMGTGEGQFPPELLSDAQRAAPHHYDVQPLDQLDRLDSGNFPGSSSGGDDDSDRSRARPRRPEFDLVLGQAPADDSELGAAEEEAEPSDVRGLEAQESEDTAYKRLVHPKYGYALLGGINPDAPKKLAGGAVASGSAPAPGRRGRGGSGRDVAPATADELLSTLLAEHPRIATKRQFLPGQTYEPQDLNEYAPPSARERRRELPPDTSALEADVLMYADFKNVEFLEQFLSPAGRLLPRKDTKLPLAMHKYVVRQIKLARHMGFIAGEARLDKLHLKKAREAQQKAYYDSLEGRRESVLDHL